MGFQWLFDRFIAHRGLHDETHGENTLEAFRAAIDNGYNIELDVQLTKDNVPVIFHDIHLKRLTGRDAYVRSVTYGELKDIRYPKSGQRIPSFEEALRLCEGRTGIMCELKDDDYYTDETTLEQTVAPILASYRGEYVVKSFNPFAVDYYRRHNPAATVGYLCVDPNLESVSIRARPTVERLLFGGERERVHFFDYAVNLLETPLAARVRESGMPVITWTVRDQATYERCRGLCDNIIFEDFRPRGGV